MLAFLKVDLAGLPPTPQSVPRKARQPQAARLSGGVHAPEAFHTACVEIQTCIHWKAGLPCEARPRRIHTHTLSLSLSKHPHTHSLSLSLSLSLCTQESRAALRGTPPKHPHTHKHTHTLSLYIKESRAAPRRIPRRVCQERTCIHCHGSSRLDSSL